MKKTIFCCMLSISCCILLTGCPSIGTGEIYDYSKVQKLNLQDDANKLHESVNTINKNTDNIVIKQETAKIQVVATDLESKDNISDIHIQYILQLEKENADLKSEKTRALDYIFLIGIIIGFIIVLFGAAGIVACYGFGVTTLAGLSFILTACGIAVMFFSGVMYFYFWWGVTFIAAVLAFAGILLTINFFRSNSSIVQLVKTGQLFLTSLDEEKAKAAANDIQSKSTQKIVAKVKQAIEKTKEKKAANNAEAETQTVSN